MPVLISAFRPEAFRKVTVGCLALCWIAGLLCGFLCSHTAGPVCAAWMRGFLFDSVSIVGLPGLIMLPYLISAAAVFISAPWLLFLACFGRAFVFSFVSLWVARCSGGAGWLVWLLILGADLPGMVLLWLSWLRSLRGGHHVRRRCTAFLLCVALCLALLECRIVIPFSDSVFGDRLLTDTF